MDTRKRYTGVIKATKVGRRQVNGVYTQVILMLVDTQDGEFWVTMPRSVCRYICNRYDSLTDEHSYYSEYKWLDAAPGMRVSFMATKPARARRLLSNPRGVTVSLGQQSIIF